MSDQGKEQGACIPRSYVATPSIGRIVHYTLTRQQADEINRRRNDAREKFPWHSAIRSGAQVHVGNEAKEGQILPLIITAVWGDTPRAAFNGSCFLDGNDILWVTSTSIGEGPGSVAWPTRT